MSALACAATQFMGGNGHFISGRGRFSDCEVSLHRDVVYGATSLPRSDDDRPICNAEARGFAQRSAYDDVVDR